MVNKSMRPNRWDKPIRIAACAALFEECKQWEGWTDRITAEVLAEHADDDGYAFAKNLDMAHLAEPDAELVTILDGYFGVMSSCHDAAVDQWVKDNGISMPDWAKEGTWVLATGSGYHRAPGTIRRADPAKAQLVVLLDEDAHRAGLCGTYFPLEGVEVANG